MVGRQKRYGVGLSTTEGTVKLPPFEYHRADSLEEAVALLGDLGDESKVLAGGQSLVPLLSLRLARPAHLVDINEIPELGFIRNGAGLEIGATVRHRTAERSAAVRTSGPLLAAALGFIGHPAIRNRGTIGGSVAHADPAAELPTVMVALGGEIDAQSTRGTRTVAAESFAQGFLTTVLEPDELLTAIRLPPWPASTGWSFREFSRRSGDFAIVGVATVIGLGSDDRVSDARIVFSGVGGTPVRAVEAERAVVGERPSAELWADAAERAAAGLDPPADLHGSAPYRRQLARVLARRSLKEAYDRAIGSA
jgi:carbon-monoxide dehydrogenase medium subunit